jgi:charged multivesicular body protein 4A/B
MLTFIVYRAQLQEQNALSEEIVNAITSNQVGEPIDDEELEDELEAMQQEQLDERMLKSGPVPVSDSLNRMPAVGNGERRSSFPQEATAMQLT